MFGSAIGSPENQYQISDGWFANLESVFDPNGTYIDNVVGTVHNPYGFIDAPFNYKVYIY